MTNFKLALGKFLTGEIEFAELSLELDKELLGNSVAAPEMLQLLNTLYGQGRLPEQLYQMLRQRIPQTAGMSPPRQTGSGFVPSVPPESPTVPGYSQPTGGDFSQPLSSGPQAGSPQGNPGFPPNEDDGKTQLRVRKPEGPVSPPDDGRTHLRGAASGAPGRPMPPGPQGGFTGHPELTGRTGQTGQTGRTGQSAQTGQTGQTGQSGWQTGTGASSWSNPDQWTGTQEGAPTVGSILKGRFVLENIIGHGGMGIVFKAKDLRKEEAQDRNPYIAVKILNEEFKKHPESLKALQRESRKAQDLAHPNIVTVFDFDRDGGNVFMTMEYMDGEALDRFIKRYANHGLSPDKAIPMIRDMANGLAYAHDRGIIHSDFKPANAFLTKTGVVKVFDFGIARAAKISDHASGEMTLFDAGSLGALTPAYATISMIEGDDPDQRDDIYALACVSYELFTGTHPYNKRSALKAKQAGMTLQPVEGLTRRQWRGLQKGLSFDREKQPPTVVDFMQDIEPRQINKAQLAVGAVAAILIIVLLATWVPGYLQDRHLDELIATILSGEDTEIALILDELQDELTTEQQSRVYRDNDLPRDALLDYFRRNITTAIDPKLNAYDYVTAQSLIARAQKLFPDSSAVAQIADNIAQRKQDEILTQSNRLDAALLNNILLASQGEGSAQEVLDLVARIDQNHALLSDPRLPGAFAKEGQAALNSGDLFAAESLVDAGLAYAPQDPVLLNLRESVNSTMTAFKEAQRVAALEQQLASLGTSTNINDYVRALPEIQELASLSPNGTVTRQISRNLESAIAADVQRLNGSRDFDSARQRLTAFSDVASGLFVTSQQQTIQKAEGDFKEGIQRMLGAIQQTAAAGGYAPPNEGVAEQELRELENSGADAATLVLARQAILQGYLYSARSARDAGDFAKARSLASVGLRLNPDSEMADFLQQELADIDAAEEGQRRATNDAEGRRLAAERAENIKTLQQEFETGIASDAFTLADGRRLANTIQRLQSLGDSGSVVSAGRTRIADALLRQSQARIDVGDWDGAREIVAGTQALLPENAAVANFSSNLENQFERSQALLAQQAQQSAQQNFDQLMAAGTIDRAWIDNIWQTRARLGGDAAFTQKSNQEIATKISKQVGTLSSIDRITEARELLNRGFALMPNNQILTAASTNLERAESAFASLAAERERDAALQARIQKVRDQASANNVEQAIASFESLRADLPENHVFVRQDAPILFADAYMRLARTDERTGRLDNAQGKLKEAARWAPAYGPLQEETQRIAALIKRAATEPAQAVDSADAEDRLRDRIGTLTAAVNGKLSGSADLVLAELQRDLTDLKAAAGSDYASREQQFVSSAVTRLDALKSSDLASAHARLATLKKIFPVQQAIQAYVLPALGGSTKSTTTVADSKPAVRRSSGPDACGSADLAGRGTVPRASCRDGLGNDKNAPAMVVIPAGGPVAERFAISKYEITVFDFNQYCTLSGSCAGRTGTDVSTPITNLSLADAQKYASWLTETTGFEYRIPSAAEWQYAAESPGTNSTVKNYNCQIRADGALIKGVQLEDVRTGDSNGWGLKNVVGNAQEWVLDGNNASVRGGSFQDSYEDCAISLQRSHNGQPDIITGFRLVREVTGTGS